MAVKYKTTKAEDVRKTDIGRGFSDVIPTTHHGILVNYVESLKGCVCREHCHPDGIEITTLLKGKVTATIGESVVVLEKTGDRICYESNTYHQETWEPNTAVIVVRNAKHKLHKNAQTI